MAINETEKIKEARKNWQEGTLKKNIERMGMIDPPAMYTPTDIEGFDFIEDVGFPWRISICCRPACNPCNCSLVGQGESLWRRQGDQTGVWLFRMRYG